MGSGGRAMIVSVVAALALVGTGAGVASAQQTIGPRQHLIGFVNGSNRQPVVYTVCPGPIGPGRTGPVQGGQTMSVAQAAHGRGYTGPFNQIYSWFVPAPGSGAPTMLKFTTYGAAQPIPTSVHVPCSGKGQVQFSSCPYLAPCAAGWVPYVVTVRFIDIAVYGQSSGYDFRYWAMARPTPTATTIINSMRKAANSLRPHRLSVTSGRATEGEAVEGCGGAAGVAANGAVSDSVAGDSPGLRVRTSPSVGAAEASASASSAAGSAA